MQLKSNEQKINKSCEIYYLPHNIDGTIHIRLYIEWSSIQKKKNNKFTLFKKKCYPNLKFKLTVENLRHQWQS